MPHRWCDSANLRRTQIESGLDITFNEVFKPIFIDLISKNNPESLLEIGAGTGHLAKELSRYVSNITAIEPSTEMYLIAKQVLENSNVSIENCLLNDLSSLGDFELAYSHMVVHVVDDIKKFLLQITQHLVTKGQFIFSIPHPAFYNDYKKLFKSNYNYMNSFSSNISFKITKDPNNVITDVPYHHRPLSIYINSIIESGFGLVRFDEIYPSKDIQIKYGTLWKTPRYCMFQCVKL